MTSVQTILSAAFPAGIPPERFGDLLSITEAAQTLAGFAEEDEPEPEGLEALFADLNNPPIGQEFVEHNHYETVYDISEEPAKNAIEPNSVSHPEFRPKHLTQATPESQAITAQIIEMRDCQELTWKEIAEVVGLTEEATRKRYRYHNARKTGKEIAAEKSGKELIEKLNPPEPEKEAPPQDRDEIDEYIIDCRSKSWLDHEIAQGIERNFSQTWTAQKVGDRIREMLRRSV